MNSGDLTAIIGSQIYTALDHNQSHLNTLALTKSLNLEEIGTSHVSEIGILALTIIIDYYCQLYRKNKIPDLKTLKPVWPTSIAELLEHSSTRLQG